MTVESVCLQSVCLSVDSRWFHSFGNYETPTMATDPNASLECTLCGSTFAGLSRNNEIPMCTSCYDSAFQAEMDTVRVMKFEEADFVCDNIYLGPEGSTISEDWLKDKNITRILSVAAHMNRMPHFDGIEYLQLDVDDDPKFPIRPHWDHAFPFISKTPTNTNILLHCVSGISRSGATLSGYLMKTKGMRYAEALEFIRARRAIVSPNSGFKQELLEYEQELLSTSSGKSEDGAGVDC